MVRTWIGLHVMEHTIISIVCNKLELDIIIRGDIIETITQIKYKELKYLVTITDESITFKVL